MSSELKPRTPRTVYMLKRAETAVRNGLEACLQPLEITPAQFTTLSLLRQERDQSSAELARRAGITPQSMSETIALLIRKGLIERLENPEHRRILMARLTDAGDALLAECGTRVDVMEARLLSDISEQDLEVLRRTLRAIVNSDCLATSTDT